MFQRLNGTENKKGFLGMNSKGASNKELRVLALCPTAKDFELTSGILQRAGIEGESCSDLTELCTKINEGAGAILVVEESLSTGGSLDVEMVTIPTMIEGVKVTANE